MKEKVQISKENLIKIYRNANDDTKQALENEFGADIFKTSKIDNKDIESVELTEKEQKSNDAFVFLTKLCKLLNKGWIPSKGDYGYFIYSRYLWNLLFSGSAPNGAYAGFGYLHTHPSASYTFANIGARLCFKSEEDVQYVIENYSDRLKDLFMVEQ